MHIWSNNREIVVLQMRKSRGFLCRICKQKCETKKERDLHYKTDHEGESPYHCAKCGKGYASKSAMYGHAQVHRDRSQLSVGAGIHKCPHCDKEFTIRDSYREHLLIHEGPRHKCPQCPKEFVQKSNLVRHMRRHTGEKPYKCLYCEKLFSDKGACNSHIRVHTREESCSCRFCGQTFSKKQKLKYHIRRHTGEDLLKCDICSKSFTNSFALKEHRVTHNQETQYLCGDCGKGFNSEKYLQRHVAIVHDPTHTFPCPSCPKVFSQRTRLKAHLMTHTGVKHLKCLVCDKGYSDRKSLRRHLLEKHQISPEHPQYKECFYVMSAEEAQLHIPKVEPKSLHSTEDEDSAGEFSKEDGEGRSQSRVKSPKKADISGPENVDHIDPTYSAASEDCSSSSASETERRRSKRLRKKEKRRQRQRRKPPIKNTNDNTSPSTSGRRGQWTSSLQPRTKIIIERLQFDSQNSGRNTPEDLDMEVVEEDDEYDEDMMVEVKEEIKVEIKEEIDDELHEESGDGSDSPLLKRLIPKVILKSPPSDDEECNEENS